MHRKLSSILLSFVLVAGLMAILPATANSATSTASPTSFHPDEDGTNVSNGVVLADRFDGTDTTAHLTAVTNSAPDRVQWRVCPTSVTDAGAPGGGVSQAELGQCNIVMGEDTSATVPGTSGVFTSADEAYDINFDVPASLDNQTRDILILACVGSGETVDNSGGGTVNCQSRLEEGIILDDANTGEPDATTGEMVSYCTRDTEVGGVADTGGPQNGGTAATDPCEQAYSTGTSGANSDAAIAARFKAFPHGAAVPNNGFVLRATTSTDVTDLHAARDYGADSDQDPQTNNDDTECTNLQTQADRITWECAFSNDAANDNDIAQAVWIYNSAGGTAAGPADCSAGAVATTCTLDSHFAVSQARRANSVIQSFVPGGTTHSPPSPNPNAGCQTGQTAEKTHSESTLGGDVDTRICVRDQFTDPFSAPVTEEASGPGELSSCATTHDHDANGSLEHCHEQTGDNGEAQQHVDNFGDTPGTVTLTSCVDPQNGGTAQNPPANHGCADAPANLKDTLTLTYGTRPDQVFLAFNNPAPGNAADPCRTGQTFKNNDVGDFDDITVCTYDLEGNPIATDTNSFRLIWQIEGAQGNEPTAVRFNPAPPPQETSGSTGTASARLEAVQEGDNFITVTLLNEDGDPEDSFTIEKQVEGEAQAQTVPTSLTAKKSRRKIRGKASTPKNPACQPNRQVTLYKRTPGPNRVIGQDITNQFGRYGIRVPKPRRGRYYARVTAANATDSTGQSLNCLGDQSDDVRWRRRRR